MPEQEITKLAVKLVKFGVNPNQAASILVSAMIKEFERLEYNAPGLLKRVV